MIDSLTYYIYGLCTMFYSMMAWMFWRKGGDMLSRLFSILMIITCAESFKDLFIYIENKNIVNEGLWNELTAMDMVVIPIYNFILKELVKPGWLTWKKIILHETVFIVLIAGLFISNAPIWFHCLVGWGCYLRSRHTCCNLDAHFRLPSSVERPLLLSGKYQSQLVAWCIVQLLLYPHRMDHSLFTAHSICRQPIHGMLASIMDGVELFPVSTRISH